MKNLRKLFLATAALLAFVACETDADTVAEIKDEAGLLVSVSATSNSSILGNPAPGVDLEDAEVTVTNAYLNMTVSKTAGSINQLEKIEIVKSFNGGEEISLGESTSLPYTLEVSSLDDLLAGTGVAANALRIGDVLNFRTKVYKTDGSVYYFNSSMGDYSLVINCASDLAGSYTVNYTSGPAIYNVTEVSPGKYESDQMLGWPTSGYWVRFTDTCGVISFDINEWRFSGGNPVSGTGYVDADGNLVWTSVSVAGTGLQGGAYTMFKN
ncbi:hypothetical protein [Algibacter sp. PT7-4]|uniref:hypothetical protein n=1 Tax=Algibacter ulvanivorans TaxID=3400999 RepID=UPI003AAE3837